MFYTEYHEESPLHREHSQRALAWYSANGVGILFQHHFPLIFTFMYDFAMTLLEATYIYTLCIYGVTLPIQMSNPRI